MKQQARLRNYIVCPYCIPGRHHFHGTVYGHPQFKDGEEIGTSPIVGLNELLGIGETVNTIYILRDTEVDGDVQRTTETAA